MDIVATALQLVGRGTPHRDLYQEVRHRLDVEQGVVGPYPLAARPVVLAGGVVTTLGVAIGAALQGDAEAAPDWTIAIFWLGAAIMACAWPLRARKRQTWSHEQRSNAETRTAWMLARGSEPYTAWRRYLPWATQSPRGDVEIWMIVHTPQPGWPFAREVLATIDAQDTVGAAEAMADARARAEQSELDAHADHLLRIAEDEAERRHVRDQAAAQRAALLGRREIEARDAEEARLRSIDADGLANALNASR